MDRAHYLGGNLTGSGEHEQPRGEPTRSTQEGATDVLNEQDKVQVVGRAGLELGHEVEVGIPRLLRLGVDEQAPATDVVGERQTQPGGRRRPGAGRSRARCPRVRALRELADFCEGYQVRRLGERAESGRLMEGSTT